MVTVSQPQKNNSNQQQDSSAGVSLVLVSAKGRVAVYDSSSLKPSAPAFTLRLSPAPVASIKASTSHHHKPLLSTTSSSNGAAEEGGNTAAAGAASAAPTSSATTHNGPGQKVLLLFLPRRLFGEVTKHIPLLPSFLYTSVNGSTHTQCGQ